MKKAQRDLDASLIQKKLKYQTYDRPTTHWLDTGSRRLNAVFGSEEKGIPYGKVIEIYGPNHGGKTLIAEKLVAIAQEDGAKACKVDLEGSHDDEWSALHGVNTSRYYLIQPKIGKFHKKDKQPRLQAAEEMFEEAEEWMALQHSRNPDGKMIIVVDSIGMLRTRMQTQAGATGQNMRTTPDVAFFFSQHLPRWVGLALNYNAIIIMINQIRNKVGMVFGDPEYAPGGNQKNHAMSVRVKVARLKNGKVLHVGQVVGIIGIMKNVKNKAGGGSREGMVCGFKNVFGKSWKFMSKKKAEQILKMGDD